jgi:hypothetical protein
MKGFVIYFNEETPKKVATNPCNLGHLSSNSDPNAPVRLAMKRSHCVVFVPSQQRLIQAGELVLLVKEINDHKLHQFLNFKYF